MRSFVCSSWHQLRTIWGPGQGEGGAKAGLCRVGVQLTGLDAPANSPKTRSALGTVVVLINKSQAQLALQTSWDVPWRNECTAASNAGSRRAGRLESGSMASAGVMFCCALECKSVQELAETGGNVPVKFQN